MEISAVVSDDEFISLASRIDFSRFEGKRVLVSGATGMVGSWITTTFLLALERGALREIQIDALVHSGNITNLRTFRENKSLRLIKRNEISLSKNLNYDFVIHAASPASPQFFRDKESLVDINVGFLNEILEKSFNNPEIVFFSTGEVYGAGHERPLVETDEGRIDESLERSMYPLAKKQAEDYLKGKAIERDLQFNIFRLFHTFGPGMRIGDGRSFADFIWDGALLKLPKLYSSGLQVRSFLYLEDMVAAVLGVPPSNSVMNLGSSVPTSIKEFAEIVSLESGLGGDLEISHAVQSFKASPNDFLIPDVSLLESKGWKQQVNVSEGVARSIAWARR